METRNIPAFSHYKQDNSTFFNYCYLNNINGVNKILSEPFSWKISCYDKLPIHGWTLPCYK